MASTTKSAVRFHWGGNYRLEPVRGRMDIDEADDKEDDNQHQYGADSDEVTDGAAHERQPTYQAGQEKNDSLTESFSFHGFEFIVGSVWDQHNIFCHRSSNHVSLF